MDVAAYASPGLMTSLSEEQAGAVRGLGLDPVALCRAVQGLIVQPHDAFGAGLSPVRLAERNTRPARELLAQVTRLDASPLTEPRSEGNRVVGTCRHFAVLATAFLQATGVPARARCGFASYFAPPARVDHWITEYWTDAGGRWVRVDAEILGTELVAQPDDLAPGEFLTAGEAWRLVRSGKADPMMFGVAGTDNWGAGEIRGNIMRDLAALNQVEMLPWDEWGPMEDSYAGRTGAEFDSLMDEVAAACADEDSEALGGLYRHLAVPAALIL